MGIEPLARGQEHHFLAEKINPYGKCSLILLVWGRKGPWELLGLVHTGHLASKCLKDHTELRAGSQEESLGSDLWALLQDLFESQLKKPCQRTGHVSGSKERKVESLSPDRHVKVECVRKDGRVPVLKRTNDALGRRKPRAELTGYGKAKLLVTAVVKIGFSFGVTQ